MNKNSTFFLLCLLAISFTLTGCLSHCFVDTETRLQVENATEDYTILSVGIVSEEGDVYSPWIDEKLLPGERSHVVEGDWVGEFRFRIKYTEGNDGSGDTLTDYHVFDIEGGSLFLTIEASGDTLKYRFR